MSNLSDIIFTGEYESARDSKNRIRLPSKFIRNISVPQVLVRKEAAYEYPILELTFPSDQDQTEMSPEKRVDIYSFGALCSIRSGGRIAIPARFFEYLEEKRKLKRVVQSGARDRIYVWNAKDFRELEARRIRENNKEAERFS